MTLHVEDEFLLAEFGRGELRIERGLLRDVEVTAGAAGERVSRIEGEQRRGGAAGRDQKVAAVARQRGRTLGPFGRERVGAL